MAASRVSVLIGTLGFAAFIALISPAASTVCTAKGPQDFSVDVGNNFVEVPGDACYCAEWYTSKGTPFEQSAAEVMQWTCLVACLAILLWNFYNYVALGPATVAWEVVYVMGVVFTFYVIESSQQLNSPAMVYLNTGNFIVMLRYGQWLFATPVLLVSVSDMLGRHKHYSPKHVHMVIADVFAVTIFVFGCLSTSSEVKIICYMLSLAGFVYLFWVAYECFQELWYEVPTKDMRSTVHLLLATFFIGWNLHTLFSTLGPECLGWLNVHRTEVGACCSDLVAKCTYCVLASVLRIQMHDHEKTNVKDDASEKPSPAKPAVRKEAGGKLTAFVVLGCCLCVAIGLAFVLAPWIRAAAAGFVSHPQSSMTSSQSAAHAMTDMEGTPCTSSGDAVFAAPSCRSELQPDVTALNTQAQDLAGTPAEHPTDEQPSAEAASAQCNATSWLAQEVKGPQDPSTDVGCGRVRVPKDACYCPGWYQSKGTPFEQSAAEAMQWTCLLVCLAICLWNFYNYVALGPSTVAWELVYVMGIVFSFYCVEFTQQLDSPAMVYLSSGNSVVMLRYGQWLFATPVLLVSVADMLGSHQQYSHQHMYMVIADIFAVTIFVFGCLTTNPHAKLVCYMLSLAGFLYLFWVAWKCFQQLLKEVPTDGMRTTVHLLIATFFLGWNLHTLFSTLGPECLGWLNVHQTEVGACCSDLVAKCTYCVLGSVLRIQMHNYTKKQEQQAPAPVVSDAAGAIEAPKVEGQPFLTVWSMLSLSALVHMSFLAVLLSYTRLHALNGMDTGRLL